MSELKQLILNEHMSWGGDDRVKIRKAPGPLKHFFLYWEDGQIIHRDTYMISNRDKKPLLLLAEKRYHDTTNWIEE
jgi:hypothetical protein